MSVDVSCVWNKSNSVVKWFTEVDLFQTQETSTDTQTSSYIEQTTQSPVHIPISTKLSTTVRQRYPLDQAF